MASDMHRSPSHRLLILASCAVLSLAPLVARAEADNEGTFWTGYMSSWWLDSKRAIWFDTHYNVDTFFVVRGGVSHAFDAGPIATAGYAFLLLNPDFDRHEHRPWGQVFAPYRFNDRWSVSGRLRLDFRFLERLDASGHYFRFRPRLQSSVTRRFKPLRFGQPFLQVAHEILLNAYSEDDPDVLDQNRVSLAPGFDFKFLTVRLGYMNRYLPNARGGDGRFEHAAILWFTQSIDLAKRRKSKMIDYEEFPEYGGN